MGLGGTETSVYSWRSPVCVFVIVIELLCAVLPHSPYGQCCHFSSVEDGFFWSFCLQCCSRCILLPWDFKYLGLSHTERAPHDEKHGPCSTHHHAPQTFFFHNNFLNLQWDIKVVLKTACLVKTLYYHKPQITSACNEKPWEKEKRLTQRLPTRLERISN